MFSVRQMNSAINPLVNKLAYDIAMDIADSLHNVCLKIFGIPVKMGTLDLWVNFLVP